MVEEVMNLDIEYKPDQINWYEFRLPMGCKLTKLSEIKSLSSNITRVAKYGYLYRSWSSYPFNDADVEGGDKVAVVVNADTKISIPYERTLYSFLMYAVIPLTDEYSIRVWHILLLLLLLFLFKIWR